MKESPSKNYQMEAISELELLEKRDNRDLLEVTIFTGRPHQIRIHLTYLGTPLIGDPLYRAEGHLSNNATPGEGGYFLHAHKLLNIPINNKEESFEATLPHILQRKSGEK